MMMMESVNHFYEQNKCSGMFVYCIDDCKPLCIKFSARITIKVILSDDTETTRQNSENGTKVNLPNDKSSSSHIEENVVFFDNKLGKNCEDEVDKIVVKLSSDSASHTTQKFGDSYVEAYGSKELSNDEDSQPLVTDCRDSENIQKPSTNDLRQKSKELIDNVNSVTRIEIEENRVLSLSTKQRKSKKNKGSKVFGINDLNDRANNLKTNDASKRKAIRNKKSKDECDRIVKKKIKSDNAKISKLDVSNNSTKKLNGTQSKRKPRPRKLLMEKDVKCSYCDITFETKLDFFNHRRTKGSSFHCKICGKKEPFEAHLMVHMLSHEPQMDCDETDVKNENSLKRKRYKIKCSVCGLVVSSVDSLKVHMIIHTGEHPYRCCVCEDQNFFSLSSLRHHQEVHNISKRFQCKQCEMRFSSRTELSKHKLTHEINCGLCGEVFPNKTSRTCHYRVSHPNDIKRCDECFSLFSTDEELQKHILYHRKGKKEQCPECGIVVTKLKDHMIIHSRKDGEKLFACDICPMKYKRKSTLDRHILAHTGERPYACNVCPKRFRSNGMLRKHLLTHTLERPYVCEICGKRCSVRSNLATHMRIHSETRKYPCSLCFQAFNYKTSLEIHLKCKHNLTCVRCSKNFEDESSQSVHMRSAHTEERKTFEEDKLEQHQLHHTQEEQLSHGQAQHSSQKQDLNFPNGGEQCLSHGHEQQIIQKFKHHLSQNQEHHLSHLQEQHLSQTQEQHSSKSQEQHSSKTHEQHLSGTQEQHLSQTQEQHLCIRRQLLQRQVLRLPTERAPTYISQDAPMVPFLCSDMSHSNQTISSPNPVQNAPLPSILSIEKADPLSSTANFPNPTSNINIHQVNSLSSNIDSYERTEMLSYFGRERTTFTHLGSALSEQPAFHLVPPELEQPPHSINFNNVPLASSELKNKSDSNNMERYDEL